MLRSNTRIKNEAVAHWGKNKFRTLLFAVFDRRFVLTNEKMPR